MNYLAQVISSVEEMELEQVKAKAPELATAVDTCKHQVMSYVESVYVRYSDRPRQNKALADKINQLQTEVATLMDNVKDINIKLNESDTLLEQHADSIAKTDIALRHVGVVYKIHEALTSIAELRESMRYLECICKIKETEEFYKALNLQENLAAVQQLIMGVTEEKNLVLNILSNTFEDKVILQVNQNKSLLKINSQVDMTEVLSSLYYYRHSVAPLNHMTKSLWDHVFTPVVDRIVEITLADEDNFKVLIIDIVNPLKKSTYVDVFANLKMVLQFLLANFNFSLSENVTTLSYVGGKLRHNLSELLIKHCLEDTIPNTTEGLKNYNSVIEATNDLERHLVQTQIFAEDTTSLIEYANNVDVLFINKKCQEYVSQAEKYMKKDLHDLVEVGTQQEIQNRLMSSGDIDHCSVSKSVLDVISLLERILEEAMSSSDICAGRLFCTVRTICQKYITLVPEHHKKLLQTIPQQVAVFYNNCQYISYNLNQWNNTYIKKMPPVLTIDASAFNNEARQVSNIGSEMFLSFIESQIAQIQEILKDCGLSGATLEQVGPVTEKCLRQCLRQQELLKTVWHKVLPYNTYNETLGNIFNVLCTSIINALVKFEDISSPAAEQLAELFKMVQTRAPKLFTDPEEVSLFVSSWYKWNEAGFVLSASLLDINDRWADGKGPLALQFQPEELKCLIKALFQNTERRSALLAKIHN